MPLRRIYRIGIYPRRSSAWTSTGASRFIRTEEEADDLTDELIDRFGDPPPGVNALIHVALLRGEAGKAGVTDISQKQGYLKFTLRDFDMEKLSALYARPEYKGRRA